MNAKLIMLVGLVAVVVMAADPLPDTVAAYRGRYETLKAKRDAKRDEAIGKAVGVYRRELELLLANVRQRGDLDYVTAVQGELDRTKTDPTAPEKPAGKKMKHLRQAQWGARQAEDKAREAHGKALAKLRKGYSSSLRALEKRLVAANEIEEAKLARAERATIPKPVKKPEMEAKAKVAGSAVRSTVVEAWIDGGTTLTRTHEGLQWTVAPRLSLVGEEGQKRPVPVLVDGRKWRPRWSTSKDGTRRSKVYRIRGMVGGPVKIREKTAAATTAREETGNNIYIADPLPGARWYVFQITHGR